MYGTGAESAGAIWSYLALAIYYLPALRLASIEVIS